MADEKDTKNDIQTAIQVMESKPVEIQRFELQQRAARLFATSGLFADIKGQSETQSIAQAFVKIALGESMGFSPAESMTGIDIIQGRVAISANMRASRMQRAGYEWDILQLDDTACRLRLKFEGQFVMQENEKGEKVPAIVSFTMKDAAIAGLAGKDNYKKNPRNMLFARAVTNAQRWYAPGILSMNILSSEEATELPPLVTKPVPELTGETQSQPATSGKGGAERLRDAVKSTSKPHAPAEAQPEPVKPNGHDDNDFFAN